MKKGMITIALLAAGLTAAAAGLYANTGQKWLLSLAITAGTIAYHFWMRLLIGALFNLFMRNKADYSKSWYQLRRFEERLYQLIRVKQWKGRMPAYDPELFDPTKHSWDEIAQAMCQAELVHETIVVCSFVPIAAAAFFGALPVFVITSIAAAAVDMMFVIMQRYNRPRVLRMIRRDKQRACR